MASLIDSSVWIALYVEKDSQHAKAERFFNGLNGRIYVPYIIVSEVATVVTQKHSKAQTEQFFQFLDVNSEVIFIDADSLIDIEYFRKLPAEISFADSILLRLAGTLKAELVTYDKQLAALYRKQK